MTNTEWLRSRLLSNVIITPVGDKKESKEELQETEWCHEFEALMRNRLLMGRYRYARLRTGRKEQYDSVGSARERLKRYQETGNLELLVDAANLCMVEFLVGEHPLKHFESADDGEHASWIER